MFHIKHWGESLKIFILSVKSKFGGRIVTWLLSAMGRLPGVTARRQASHRLQCSPNKIPESGTLGGGMGLVLVDIVEKRGLLGLLQASPATEPWCSSQCHSQPHPEGTQKQGTASHDIPEHNASHQHQMLNHQTNVPLWS